MVEVNQTGFRNSIKIIGSHLRVVYQSEVDFMVKTQGILNSSDPLGERDADLQCDRMLS